MDQAKTDVSPQNPQKIFCKQPISCPWITAQPYPSAVNKNRATESPISKFLPSIPLSMESRTVNEKTCPSLQHSSSQFFYFLRLMQLFPETHPATLHTVLNLCKNDFFCAVDKLLYAKRCKALYGRSQNMFKRCSSNRSHPYCGAHAVAAKNLGQQEKGGSVESEANAKGVGGEEKATGVPKVQIVVESNGDVDVKDNNGYSKLCLENETEVSNTLPALLEETEKDVKDLSSHRASQN